MPKSDRNIDCVDPKTAITGLSHVNVVVDDIERATEFYERTLGFEIGTNDRGRMDYPKVTQENFARNAGFMNEPVQVHVRFLRHPAMGMFLELMCYESPKGLQECSKHNTNDLGGPRHIAFEVSNATSFFYFLKSQPDVELINASKDYGPPEELSPSMIKFFYWRDPWGVQWEIEEGRPMGVMKGIAG